MGRRLVLALCTFALVACSGGSDRGPASRPTGPVATSPAPKPSTTKPRPTTTSVRPVATTAPPLSTVSIGLQTVASGLASPVAIAFRAHDSRVYVAEQSGRVRIVANGRVLPTPVLSIAVSHRNEQGLLGLAFSPDGTKLYVDSTDPSGNTHVDEYTMRDDAADPSSRRELLFQAQPYANHNGGQVSIGPDGMLYVALGDGGSAGDPHGNAQNLGTWLGKILRINPHPHGSSPYSVPADNPFVARSGARAEIWMYGLRNPWRFSFDRATGDTWIGDVGQNAYEEIDHASAGARGTNWGWNIREGSHPYKSGSAPGARDPILETTHSAGNCAIVGGYVYRGSAISALAGVYVFGDDCRPALVGVRMSNGRAIEQRDLGASVPALTTFGEDQQGELYGASLSGTIFRLVAG